MRADYNFRSKLLGEEDSEEYSTRRRYRPDFSTQSESETSKYENKNINVTKQNPIIFHNLNN